MATTLYCHIDGTGIVEEVYSFHDKLPALGEADALSYIGGLGLNRGSSVFTGTRNTVNGPTAGLVYGMTIGGRRHVSPPIAAAFTMSGTITFNVWAAESNMSANVAINALVHKIDGATGAITLVATTARVVEVAVTTPGVNNFTVTPTSTAFKRGDRIMVTWFGDDVGTMAATYTFDYTFGSATAGVSGDTYVTFNENITFEDASPAGTQVFMTDTGVLEGVGTASLRSSFTGTDEDPLSEGGNFAQLDTGAGVLKRVSNQAAPKTVGLMNGSYWTPADFGPDVEVYATVAAAPTGSYYLFARIQGAGGNGTFDGYAALFTAGSSSVSVGRVDDGIITSLVTGNGSSTWANGDKLGLSCLGDVISVWRQPSGSGTWEYCTGTVDTTYPAAGKVGLGMTQSNARMDDLAAGSTNGTFAHGRREAWTSRGSGVQTDNVTSAASPAKPLPLRDAVAAVIVEWFTKPLVSFTLGGAALVNLRANVSGSNQNENFRCEIAVVDNDGSNPVVWGIGQMNGSLGTTETALRFLVSGDDTAVANGKRLRIRFYLVQSTASAMPAGNSPTVYYAGAAGATGDTYVTFEQSLTEFSTGPQTITLGLLDGSATLYAPTITFPPVQMTLALLDGAAALYSPTLAPKSTLTVPLLDGAATLYAPAVQPDQFVTLGLLDGAATLYAPTLTSKNTQTLGLLDGAATLYAPTVIPRPVTVTTPLLDGGATLYVPTLAQAGGAAQTITLGLLDGAATQYAPTLAPKNLLTIPLLDGAATLYAPSISQTTILPLVDGVATLYSPTLAGKNLLTVPLLDGAATLYAPTVLPGPVTVSLGLLDGAAALYAPTLQSVAVSISPPLLDGAASLFAPTLQPGPITVSPGLIDGVAALYAPTVQPDQFVTLGLLDGVATLYAPTLVPAPLGVTIPLLDGAATLSAPTFAQAQFVTVPLLDGAATLYAPAITKVNGISLGLLDGNATLYAPSVAAAPVTLGLGLLDGGATLYAPSVTGVGGGSQTLTLGLIDGGATTYAPSIAPLSALTVPLLDGGAAPYAPSLKGVNALSPGLLDGAASLFAPTVYPDQFVTLPVLDGGATLYDLVLTLGAGPQSVSLPLLDAVAALYPPTFAQDQFLTLGLLDAGAALYAPAMGTFLQVTTPLLDGNAALYQPSLTTRSSLATPLIDSGAVLYGLALTGSSSLGIPFLSAVNQVYAPTLTSVAVAIVLGLIDGNRALYAPTVADRVLIGNISGTISQRPGMGATVTRRTGNTTIHQPGWDAAVTSRNGHSTITRRKP